MTSQFDIMCLVPDLPAPKDVLPMLERMHEARWYSNFGPLNQEFEAEMARFLGSDTSTPLNVVSFSSATTALELTLKTMGLPHGARVLVPALTFPATALAVMRESMEPVFGDVDPDYWALTPDLARNYATHTHFDAVMPVAPFGHPVDMDGWARFQSDTGIKVIVDAAAALGQQAVHPDIPVCFSLHATKPFGVGEGGILVTGDENLALMSRRASNFGFIEGKITIAGTNAKMAEYFAAMGIAQKNRFEEVRSRRQKVYDWYQSKLSDLNSIRQIKTTMDSLPAVFCIRTNGQGEEIASEMANARVQTRRWYLPTMEEHPPLKEFELISQSGDQTLPVCSKLSQDLIGLPFHGFLTESDVAKVTSILKEVLK